MTTQQIPSQPSKVIRVIPRAGSRDGTAPLKNNPTEMLHLVLFVAGAALLPLGLIVIGFAWYGAAHTPYAFDQMSYLVSGVFGLGVTFVGGFLYFGSWLAKLSTEQKDAQRQLADRLVQVSNATAAATAGVDKKVRFVQAGRGVAVHRDDCGLISDRDDLRTVDLDAGKPCRVCQPSLT